MSEEHQTRADELTGELRESRRRIAALEREAERSRLLDRLIATLPDGFALIDAGGRHLEVNAAFCEMTGYSRDELLQMTMPFAYWPPEETAAIRQAFAACVDGTTETLELTFMRRDGERFPVLVTPTIVRGADGAMQVGMATFKDVSRLRHVEQALAVSRTDFRALVEGIREVFARYDLDLRFTYVSPVIERWLPLQPAAMLGRTNREAGFSEELAELFDDVLGRVLDTLTPASVEYRITGRDGELVAESSVYPDFGPDGGLVALTSVTRDVTARVRAEQALRESEEKYRSLVERASDAVIITDGERCLFGNARAAELSGYPQEELRGLTLAAVVPEDARDELLERARLRLAGGPAPDTYVTDLVKKDGGRFTAEISAGVVTYDGAPASLLIVRDVTERVRTAEALRAAEARFRSLFEGSPVPIFETDASALAGLAARRDAGALEAWAEDLAATDPHADGVTGIHVVHVNEAAVRLCGAADADELAAHFERCVTTDLLTKLPGILAGLAAGGRTFTRRTSITTFAGETRVVDLHGSVLPGHEATLGRVLVSFIDVTEVVAAETEIRHLNTELQERVASRTEQRDALNHELEAFAYSIAHDVRAPLRTIDGFSAIVLEDARDRLLPADVAHLTRVREASRRMGELIDDLLGLSRMSRRELARTAVDVGALAAEVAAELSAEAPGRRVELTVTPGMTASADPVLLRLVLRELLDNAWKFTAGRDPAHVEVGRAAGDGAAPAFYVKDDGAGYDPRFAEHLFGVFQRMHPAADFEGNGIGLATVQRLVARHGGRVWAEGAPGRGATFWFSLPDDEGAAGREDAP